MGKPTLKNCVAGSSNGTTRFTVKQFNHLTDTSKQTKNRLYATKLNPCYLTFKDRLKYGYNN
jgi:hypothetical protein